VPEEIMKDIRLDQIVELLGTSYPNRHREMPRGQMSEELLIGNQPRHGNDAPATGRFESLVDRLEARNARRRGAQQRGALAELPRRVTAHQRKLSLIERGPERMILRRVLLPVLIHGVVGAGTRIISAQTAR